MAKTVADQFAQILIAAGVKRIYGIVGDSLNGLTWLTVLESLQLATGRPTYRLLFQFWL
jgi:hypothetical protein